MLALSWKPHSKLCDITSLLWREWQTSVVKCVPHLQPNYFFCFNQWYICFLAFSLTTASQILKSLMASLSKADNDGYGNRRHVTIGLISQNTEHLPLEWNFRKFLFLVLTRMPGNFCTICPQLKVPDKIDRFICFSTGATRFSGKWYGTFLFSFSKYRTCSTICGNILTENFIQMVSAHRVRPARVFNILVHFFEVLVLTTK